MTTKPTIWDETSMRTLGSYYAPNPRQPRAPFRSGRLT
jgi:hypothetical protein